MPVSLHKILLHGREILATCILPIGQFSEEAQKARNKDNRRYRQSFTRKTSRMDTDRDLINRLLITSDPYIASLRSSPHTNHRKMGPDIQVLLEIENTLPEGDNSEDISDEESVFSDSE